MHDQLDSFKRAGNGQNRLKKSKESREKATSDLVRRGCGLGKSRALEVMRMRMHVYR